MRFKHNKNISKLDKDIFKQYSSKFETDSFREDSFTRNITGLYSWDINKGYKGEYENAFEFRKQKILKCELECDQCQEYYSCEKYIRDSYRIVRMSIHDQEIKQAKTTSKSTNSDLKPTKPYSLERYSPSIYCGNSSQVDMSAYFPQKK